MQKHKTLFQQRSHVRAKDLATATLLDEIKFHVFLFKWLDYTFDFT